MTKSLPDRSGIAAVAAWPAGAGNGSAHEGCHFFAVNPRRWVVERFFAWIGRNRRLAKDFEATIDSARAFLYAASVMLLVRRIARTS
jgi:transposase